ncbi:MAG: TetR/AcrR family transcriptional regulator [Azoarcus sp.]|jgi:AcrR family transcriptional regulator|nr:TetR/AcrR family transcriptional regulator [Azoarcus sp.]
MKDDVSAAATSSECSRAAARRAQILDAAAQCFRDDGFHGASIASISQRAGMSAGHIYHYFDNKEAIIAAIVERDLDRLVLVWAELRAVRDIGETMVRLSGDGVKDVTDVDKAVLQLEILSEAVRNEEVARVVHAADCCCMANLMQHLRAARQAAGKRDDEKTLAAMAEVVAAMFEGLMLRTIRNPAINREHMSTLIQRVMRTIISSPDWRALD